METRLQNLLLRSVLLILIPVLVLGGCGGSGPDADGDDAAMSDPRIAAAPTAEGVLPSAIVGEGGELGGVDLTYVEGDPLTVGYLAVPEGEGPFPSLIIIHEWNGLSDRIRQMADDFAGEGYVTLAADLYQGALGSTREENQALMRAAGENPEATITNLNAATAYLRSRPDVTGRVGAMGWCFGGGVALSFGLDGDQHDATAIFYGRLVDDPETLSTMDHEVYGTFAELDGGIPPEAVNAFQDALRSVGIDNDIHVYDAVQHGFWLRVDEDPEGRTAPAIAAWERLKAYLDRTLSQ